MGGGPCSPSASGKGPGAARPEGGAQGMEEFLELLGGHILIGVGNVAPVLVLQ